MQAVIKLILYFYVFVLYYLSNLNCLINSLFNIEKTHNTDRSC